MRQTLVNEARDLLREETTELELAIKNLYPDLESIKSEFERKVLGHSEHDWFAKLVGPDQVALYRSDNYPDLPSEQNGQSSKLGEPVTYQSTGSFQLVKHSVLSENGNRFEIVLGTPNEVIDNDIWILTNLMLFIGAGLLVVAPIGGYLLARNATQPVRKIISTTRSLNPSSLDSRLEIRGTGDELDQISVEINSFLDQISKYLNSHREFIANAAHELRSPLTAIQTSVEVSLGKVRTVDEYRDELETVSEQCEQLRHLVNQLLELAETDVAIRHSMAGDFDLTEMIEKSTDVFAGIAEEKQVVINTQLQPNVVMQGDSSKIRQVVNNLIDNALKFTPEGGQVFIELAMTLQQIRFVVRDTGAGVPESELNKIFDRFYQIEPSRQRDRVRGNGLGLSICKSIVEMHRGRISASLPAAGGLEVVVSFEANSGDRRY